MDTIVTVNTVDTVDTVETTDTVKTVDTVDNDDTLYTNLRPREFFLGFQPISHCDLPVFAALLL